MVDFHHPWISSQINHQHCKDIDDLPSEEAHRSGLQGLRGEANTMDKRDIYIYT